jgi:hypothetical protein
MYKDLKTRYWWYGMKRDITEYVSLGDTCQRVKDLPESEGRVSKISRIATTFENLRIEMGIN